MLVLCTLWYKIPQNIINSLITSEINRICYNVKSFNFLNKLMYMYHNTLKHPQLIYNKLCKGIASSNKLKIIQWYKVTSMSSLTACPFSAEAAAAKSGFILLQNPHPGWERITLTKNLTQMNYILFISMTFLNWAIPLLHISKPKVQKYENVLQLENTDKHINWLIAFKKSMQHWS